MAVDRRYRVDTVTIEELLGQGSARYQVPPFQRNYAWGNDEIEQMLDDFFPTEESPDDTPYFLGSIVLAFQESGEHLILDGQQRLITVSLILAGLQDLLGGIDNPEAGGLSQFLTSGRISERKKPKIRLQQNDDGLFETILTDYKAAKVTRGFDRTAIGRALRKIEERIRPQSSEDSTTDSSLTGHYLAMAEKVLYHVELVRIEAPSEADAFRLFETLNDRGLDLNAADLVKNKLFAQCGSRHLQDIIEIWQEIVELVGQGEMVNFLRHWWIAHKAFVRRPKVYDSYRSLLEGMSPNEAASFALELGIDAASYSEIAAPSEQEGSLGAGSVLQRLLTYNARIGRPALLSCAHYLPGKFEALAKVLESATVRYSVVGELNSGLLEREYGRLCEKIRERQDNGDVKLLEIVGDLSGMIPDDDEFRSRFAGQEILNVSKTWRTILVEIAEQSGTGETRINNPSKVHVEHVLPRNPSQLQLRRQV